VGFDHRFLVDNPFLVGGDHPTVLQYSFVGQQWGRYPFADIRPAKGFAVAGKDTRPQRFAYTGRQTALWSGEVRVKTLDACNTSGLLPHALRAAVTNCVL
jgi:hypothetical protein